MWTVGDYTPGSISQILSGSSTEKKKKKKKSKTETPNGSSEHKNVHFDTLSDGKEHKKYEKTPYSEVGKKNKKADDTPELKPEKRKLVFDDSYELTQPKKLKKSKKKKKVAVDVVEAQDDENINVTISNKGPGKKKKKKIVDNEDKLEIPEPKESIEHVKIDSVESESNDLSENLKNKIKQREIDPDEGKKTVFVGNVPINYTRQKITSIFSQFGPVHNVRLRCIPVGKLGLTKKEAACRKEYHPNRKSIAAFVVFKSEDSVPAALEQNGMLADDHHLRIDVPERKEHDVNKAVFVGGLPFDVEDDEVWDVFEKCGEIESVRIVRDNHTMLGKGFGYVNFTSSASVELALELDQQQIRNRKINVKRCMKIKKKQKFNKGENPNFIRRKEDNFSNSKKSRKRNFNLNEVKVTAKEVGSVTQFQGRKAGKEKKKKKKKPSPNEMKKRKIQKILASSGKKK